MINVDSVKAFNAAERTFEKLPILRVEFNLTGNFDYTVNGKNNTDARKCDGIRLVCEPNRDYISEITEALELRRIRLIFHMTITQCDYQPLQTNHIQVIRRKFGQW